MRRLKVTLVVDVAIPDVLAPHLPPVTDDEAGGRLVEPIALRALEHEGLEPVSCGYGFSHVVIAGEHGPVDAAADYFDQECRPVPQLQRRR